MFSIAIRLAYIQLPSVPVCVWLWTLIQVTFPVFRFPFYESINVTAVEYYLVSRFCNNNMNAEQHMHWAHTYGDVDVDKWNLQRSCACPSFSLPYNTNPFETERASTCIKLSRCCIQCFLALTKAESNEKSENKIAIIRFMLRGTQSNSTNACVDNCNFHISIQNDSSRCVRCDSVLGNWFSISPT